MMRTYYTLAVWAALNAAALAQCPQGWRAGDGVPGIMTSTGGGEANASTVWDPDGPGPSAALMLLGGSMVLAGDTQVRGIAAWDGERWLPTMSLPAAESVLSFGRYRGDLLAGTTTGVLRWTGQGWESLGSSIGRVYEIAEIGDHMFVAGNLWLSPTCRMARWDGTSWQTVPGQPIVNLAPGSTSINAFLVDGSTLWVGGYFDRAGGLPAFNIARLDGAVWSTVGTPNLNGNILALTRYNGELHAAGDFFVQTGTQTVRNFARFNGSTWVGIPGFNGGAVYHLWQHEDDLFLGGSFASTAGTSVVRWNGVQLLPTGAHGPVLALTTYSDFLFAAGQLPYTNLMSPDMIGGVGRWDGVASWTPLGRGFDGPVLALAEFEGDLIAAGGFRHAGNTPTGQVARRSAGVWRPMGGSFNDDVRALAVSGDDLYAGGSFGGYESQSITPVARWTGTTWTSVTTAGSGQLSGYVWALLEHSDGLLAGGYLVNGLGSNLGGVARLSGTVWEPLGLGIGQPPGYQVHVYELATLNGNVVAVGNFGSQAAFGNVAWFDGDTWNGFGAGLGRSSLNPVYCATVYQDELHVGGLFPRPGTSDAMNIAKWDGSQWMEVGGAADAVVTSMVVHQGKLVVGGNFTTIGGVSASRLAEWDGQVWRQLDGGADSVPEALLSGAVELVAGGYFLTVGGKVSPFLASYGCDTCYANCDGSTTAPVVNVADFTCFLQRIAAGDSYANCDNSTTVPTVNVADLTCFLQRFAAGCH